MFIICLLLLSTTSYYGIRTSLDANIQEFHCFKSLHEISEADDELIILVILIVSNCLPHAFVFPLGSNLFWSGVGGSISKSFWEARTSSFLLEYQKKHKEAKRQGKVN